MAENQIHIDKLLPTGEQIRGFLEQSFLSKNDLKAILKSRGVFVCNPDKQETIPLLISTILSPKEFDLLREKQSTKEDNPKTITRILEWNSDKDLVESIPQNFNINTLLKNQYNNYQVIGSPQFIPVGNNPNKLTCDFQIERRDMSKGWFSYKNNFKGSFSVEKISNGKEVELVLTHTALETKELNQKISSNLKQHFKDKGYINPESDFIKITFSSFSNEERVNFFWKLIGDNKTDILTFEDITDVELRTDNTTTLPEKIDWMQEKVKELKFKGSHLHDTPFIKETTFHKHLLFMRLDAKFKFDYTGGKGLCNISFSFPDYISKGDLNSEFEMNIGSLNLDESCKHLNKNTVKESLLKSVNSFKLEIYKKIILEKETRIRNNSAVTVGEE